MDYLLRVSLQTLGRLPVYLGKIQNTRWENQRRNEMNEEDLMDDIKFLKRKIDEPLNYVPGLFESEGVMRMRRGTDKVRLECLELELDILRIKTNDR